LVTIVMTPESPPRNRHDTQLDEFSAPGTNTDIKLMHGRLATLESERRIDIAKDEPVKTIFEKPTQRKSNSSFDSPENLVDREIH